MFGSSRRASRCWLWLGSGLLFVQDGDLSSCLPFSTRVFSRRSGVRGGNVGMLAGLRDLAVEMGPITVLVRGVQDPPVGSD